MAEREATIRLVAKGFTEGGAAVENLGRIMRQQAREMARDQKEFAQIQEKNRILKAAKDLTPVQIVSMQEGEARMNVLQEKRLHHLESQLHLERVISQERERDDIETGRRLAKMGSVMGGGRPGDRKS